MIASPHWLVQNAGLLRSLLFLAVLGGALLLSKRPRLAFPVAATFVGLCSGLWVLALARPWGLLVDPAVTLRVATAAVAGQGGNGALLGGLAPSGGAVAQLTSFGVPASFLGLLFQGAPVLASFAFLLLLAFSVRDAADRGILVVAGAVFLFSDLDLLAGTALPALAWASPRGTVIALVSLATFVAARRIALNAWVSLVAPAAMLILGVSLHQPAGAPSRLWLEALGSLSPLLLVSMLPSSRDRETLRSGIALVVAATGLAILGGGAHGFVAARGALLVASLPALRKLVAALDAAGEATVSRGRSLTGIAALFLLAAPVTAPFWWRPPALDRVTEDSLEPVSGTLVSEMKALADATKPGDVIVASPELAPYVLTVAGRPVLRAPTLVTPGDDADRQAAEFMILRGRARARLLERFGVTHVLVAPGDFTDRGVPDPESLETRPGFTLVREGAARIRLYRVTGSTPGGA